MARIPGIRRYLRPPTGKAGVERQVDQELAFHFDMCIDELVANGLTFDQARREAERRFGDVALVRARLRRLDRERLSGQRRADWWSALGHDARYASRGLRRSPTFTIGVILTLALGIGANAAVFTIIDQLLLRPPPHIADAARLRRVNVQMTFRNGESAVRGPMSFPEFVALRDGVSGFDRVAAFNYPRPAALGLGVDAPRIKRAGASGLFFATLGVRPTLGRFFTASDDDPRAAAPAAVISFGFWQRRFGGRANVIGERLVLDGNPFLIVGVAPKGFSGVDIDAPDVWTPLEPLLAASGGPNWRSQKTGFGLQVIAHLRSGFSPEQAAAQAAPALAPAYEGFFMAGLPRSVRLGSIIPGRRLDRPDSGLSIAVRLSGAAAMVLLIACANVANLLLARAMARRRELAVRLALGVGRGRLIGQLLTESVLLAAIAGSAAVLVAVWGGTAFRALLMPSVSWATPPVDARVLAFTGAVTLLVGLAAGLAPALQMTSNALTDSLKSGWRDSSRSRSAVRSGLLIVQAAFTVILLVGAGLFVRSMHNARAMDLGFDADRTLIAEVRFARGSLAPSELDAVYDALADRVRRVPQVSRVSVTTTAPFYTTTYEPIHIPGADSLPDDLRSPPVHMVPPEYFSAMGMRVTLGRGVLPDDRGGSPLVAVVTAAFARRAWPNESPLGRCIRLGADTAPCRTVVGMVADVALQSVQDAPPPQYYIPLLQAGAFDNGNRYVIARVARRDADPADVATAVRAAIKGARPGMEAIDVKPFLELIAPDIRPYRLGATMFGVFGALALLLAGVGFYAVISFGVARRTRELGIRAALGARAGDVVGLVLGQGVRVMVVGVAIGLVLALAFGRLVESLLFDASPRDPVVFAVVTVTLLAVATVASALPAWRATRIDPLVALREE